MKSSLDVLFLRRPVLNYVSPPICDVLFSSSSGPVIILNPLGHLSGVTGHIAGGSGRWHLSWDNYPGALCYSVYRATDREHPDSSEYVVIAECINGGFDTGPGCYRISAITLDGETPLSEPLCSGPPEVITDDADNVLANSARLHGQVNPEGVPTSVYFEYGLNLSYGTNTPPQDIGAGATYSPFSEDILGLTASTTYHFRAVGVSDIATVYGDDKSFTTPAGGGGGGVGDDSMPLNNAVYEPGRDKIFAVRGGYVYRLNATTGVKEAAARFICPDFDDSYIAYDSVSDRLYAGNWMTFSKNDFPAHRVKNLVQIDPDTLVATPYSPTLLYDALPVSGDTFSEGPRNLLAIGGRIYGTYFDGETGGFTHTWSLDPGSVTVIAGDSADLTGCPLSSFAFDGDLALLWVPGNGKIYAFDVPALTADGSVNVNGTNSAAKGCCYRSGYLYCTLYNLGGRFSYQVEKINTTNGAIHSTINLTRPAANPVNIRYNPYNDRIYVPTWNDNAVVVINPNDDSVTVFTGFDSPYDVVFTPTKSWAVQHGVAGLKEIV